MTQFNRAVYQLWSSPNIIHKDSFDKTRKQSPREHSTDQNRHTGETMNRTPCALL
jgi:hypothetical protein